MRKLVLLLMLLVLVDSCLAATIHGTVYDEGLNVVENVVVELNSTPIQRQVSKDGTYKFTVPEGYYTLTVKYNGQSAKESFTISQDGDYVLDLFLFSSFEEEDELVKDSNSLTLEEEYFKENGTSTAAIMIVIALIAFSGGLFYYLKTRKPTIKVGIEDIKEESNDEDLQKCLEFIKKQGGRTTQKDIRKNFPMSEAKISLIITELEHNGKLQKIRKGRSNVIILKK
ncbi:hypothetical protein FJZ53_00355 [Candidatus Woesearchaeota archaeon]|nr:hypothetical protein [Candidatus Woesearchaeota archaeon]